MSTRKEVAEAIYQTYEEWEFDHTPEEINSGMCVAFAEQVQEKFGGVPRGVSSYEESDGVHVVGCEIGGKDPMDGKWGGHVWILSAETGTHHDAEVPYGVENWQDLPFYQRREGLRQRQEQERDSLRQRQAEERDS